MDYFLDTWRCTLSWGGDVVGCVMRFAYGLRRFEFPVVLSAGFPWEFTTSGTCFLELERGDWVVFRNLCPSFVW